MSFLRSQDMGLFTLVMPSEYIWEIMNGVGELNCLQFEDYNQNQVAFNRPYSKYIKMCEEMESKLDYIEIEMRKMKKPIRYCENIELFFKNLNKYLYQRGLDDRTYFHDLDVEIAQTFKDLLQLLRNLDNLIIKYHEGLEHKQVLKILEPHYSDDSQYYF